ncbi:glycosyl transferase [Spirulina sp. 06S082]|uniref:glycosyl transferase n=1 Tax=Spirulina sp. 06S082 TaxID=3110248 RepID=UPI002B2150E3|nr:glycosyl transferase [Spirulina sp. 06S082]MEA5468790.1 glycosyl transferase [Spirulina sp. 06S082]
MQSLYIAITNHGFGHATRAASVAGMVKKLNPDILLILVTTAPRWLLESYIEGDFIHRPRALDVGVIQSDSLTMNKQETLTKLEEIRTAQYRIIAGEVNFIQTNRISLILGDIPPLAAPIAKTAGIPCWMMSNFGWDFIYRDWGEDFAEIAAWIGECFGQCDRLFRLPLHESMSAFPHISDVGLTGGTPRFSEEEIRTTFNLIQPQERTILLTFGGLGLQQIPYHKVEEFPDRQFITFDRHAPDFSNLIKIRDRQYRPVDFMPFCDRVVSKPGFSTFSEALRLNIPIVSLSREGFAEASLLESGLRNYGHHQIISPDAFFQGNWEFLLRSPNPPQQTSTLATDGTETIARAIVEYFAKLIL